MLGKAVSYREAGSYTKIIRLVADWIYYLEFICWMSLMSWDKILEVKPATVLLAA